jgi:nucleolar protein 4
VITDNSPVAASLPAEELEKRMNSFNARRNLLKTNPSLYVSKTRLSVRQIPVGVTEYMLKRLANYAVREFEEEVAKGEREPLDKAEMEVDETDKIKARKGKKSGQKVKQAKIVRESSKADALTGKGKSKGYGFLELHEHEDALRVLRWVNNNRAVGGLWDGWWKFEAKELIKKERGDGEEGAARLKKLKEEAQREGSRWKATNKTLIVEFSIENVQVTERRKTRQITSSVCLPLVLRILAELLYRIRVNSRARRKRRRTQKRHSDQANDRRYKHPNRAKKFPKEDHHWAH